MQIEAAVATQTRYVVIENFSLTTMDEFNHNQAN